MVKILTISRVKNLKNTNLIFTNDKNILKKVNFFIIIPTPIDSLNRPDLTMLKNASKFVGNIMNKNATIIYESTTFPGCTEEFCIPILEKYSNYF